MRIAEKSAAAGSHSQPRSERRTQIVEESWLNQLDDVILGPGISLLRWRGHPRDMPPSRFPTSPTLGDSSMTPSSKIRSQHALLQRLPAEPDLTAWQTPQILLAGLYAIYGFTMTILLATLIPPFQNPDEVAHFMRADQIANGGLLGRNFGDSIGGNVDASIRAASAYFSDMPQNLMVKVVPGALASAKAIGWRNETVAESFSNTALYGPALYLPSVVAIKVSKFIGFSVVKSLYLARTLTGVASVAFAVLAILIAGSAAPWIFVVLSLPMSISQMVACSQDGLVFSLSAIICAFIGSHLLDGRHVTRKVFVALCIALIFVSAARPPYAFGALALFFVQDISWRERWIGVVSIIAATVLWSAYLARYIAIPLRTDVVVNPIQQIMHIITHPTAFPNALANSFVTHGLAYGAGFIGNLGSLDVHLSMSYWLFAALVLVATLAWSMSKLPRLGCNRVVTFAVVLVGCVSIFGIQYLTWTGVGSNQIDGVQGRYFIPFALFLVSAFTVQLSRLPRALILGFGVFSLVSAVEIFRAVVTRYY
jgi:uncharacterized membrane protein